LHPGCDPEQAQLAIDALKRVTPLPPPPFTAQLSICNIPLRQPKMEPPLGLTVNQALQRFGPSARAVLKRRFTESGVAYLLQKITLIALKQEAWSICLLRTKVQF